MKCMSCLGVVVRLNSFRGFNLAHTLVKTPFKTPSQEPVFRLPVALPTAVSIGTDTQGDPEVSGSVRSTDKGTETTSLASRITRSAAKQTLGSSPRPKRVYSSPSKGSSSKRQR